jgi:acylphosphatase
VHAEILGSAHRRHEPPGEDWPERTTSYGRGVDVRLTAFVKGHVQGVGYRWWTRSRALELGLAGSATNLGDGRVEVVAEGPEQACRALLERLPTGPGRVVFVAERWGEPRGGLSGFAER